VDESIGGLRAAIETAKTAAAVQRRIDELDAATHDWAGLRMNRAIQSAIGGKALGSVEKSVEHARGVEAHLVDHGALPKEGS
jgi:molecular chaperone HscA